MLLLGLAAQPGRGAFLQNALPLEPVLATPADLLSNGTETISVSERMTLTVSGPSYTSGGPDALDSTANERHAHLAPWR